MSEDVVFGGVHRGGREDIVAVFVSVGAASYAADGRGQAGACCWMEYGWCQWGRPETRLAGGGADGCSTFLSRGGGTASAIYRPLPAI